jgi:molybdenum storage protein
MARIIGGDGLHRTHIETHLMRESLVDKQVLSRTASERERPLVPDANIVCLGGRSIIDRGAKALFPLVEEIAALKSRHKMVVGVGSGTRGRHTFAIAMDLGIPTGGLAALVGAVNEQNTKLVQALLAPHGGIHLIKDNLLQLQLYLQAGMIPVTVGIPPYRFWEPPAKGTLIPSHGPDCGLFLLGEVLGARSLIYLKDEDGLYTDDPKRNPDAKRIAQATVSEIEALDLPDLPIEREVLNLLRTAHHYQELRIINGLEASQLRRALEGERVGTLITKD